MDDPDFVRELDSTDDPKSVAAKRQRDLENAGTEAEQALCYIGFTAVRGDGEGRPAD